MKKKKYSSK